MTRRSESAVPLLAVVLVAVLAVVYAGTTVVSAAGESLDRLSVQPAGGLQAPPHAVPAPDEGGAPGALSVVAHGDDDDHMMGDWDWDGWWVVWPIMMVLFWGGIIAVAVWGIRQFTKGRERGRTALDIVKERYARGEINAEEFERLRRDLS